jgi:hypothetical protein
MDHVCCFCGKLVAKQSAHAVEIALTSLWHKRNPVVQGLQAHSACFAKTLHPDIPFDEDVWLAED